MPLALPVAAVTLDAYGTLFEGGSDDLIQIVTSLHKEAGLKVPVSDILQRREQLIGELEKRDFMTMRDRDRWILDTLFREYNLPGDPAPHVQKLYESYFAVKPYPDAHACVDALKRKGVKIAVLSNSDVDMMKRILADHGFANQFDAVVTSESAKAYKPARRIFESAARSLGVPAGSVLHVGDSFTADVVGAKRAGMRAAWLARPGGLPAPTKREAKPDLKIDSLAKLATRVEAVR